MNLHALSFTFTYTHAPNLLIIHISNSGLNSAQLNSHSLWNDGSGSSDDIPLYFFFNNFPSLRFFSSMDAKKVLHNEVYRSAHTFQSALWNKRPKRSTTTTTHVFVALSIIEQYAKKRLINICHGKWIDVCSTHTCAHQKAPDNFNFWAFSSHDFPFLLLLLSPQPSLSMFDCCCSRPITWSARLASIYLSVHDDDATLCKKKLCYESLIGIKYNHSYGEFYLQFHFYWALYWAVGTADTANMALINSIFTSF